MAVLAVPMLLPATLPLAPALVGRLLVREEGPEVADPAALVGVTLRLGILGSGDTAGLHGAGRRRRRRAMMKVGHARQHPHPAVL